MGKKTQVEYVYELDLKDEIEALHPEESKDPVLEAKRKFKLDSVFYHNFEDFSLFKLQSVMFLITNVIPLTELVISLWMQFIPHNVESKDFKWDDDLDPNENDLNPFATKNAVWEFITNICMYLK